MAVTMKDMAIRLNTTQATVSRALRGDGSIGQEMQQRVQQLAREMGYRPNVLARSLVKGKTQTIGVLVHTLKTHFFTDFFTYFEDVCFRNGYTVLISSTEYDAERELRALRTFVDRRVDALVVARANPRTHDALLCDFQQSGGPVVLLGEDDVKDLPYASVAFDEPVIGRLAAEHLWAMGHRRVAYLSATRTTDQSLRMHRFRGELFRQAWSNVSGCDNVVQIGVSDAFYGGNELPARIETTDGEAVTAMACSTDRLALSAIAAMQGRGMRIPEAMSIVGCDDIDAAAECSVPLTTVRLSTKALASQVWELMGDDLIDAHGRSECTGGRRIVSPELVIRRSTCQV